MLRPESRRATPYRPLTIYSSRGRRGNRPHLWSYVVVITLLVIPAAMSTRTEAPSAGRAAPREAPDQEQHTGDAAAGVQSASVAIPQTKPAAGPPRQIDQNDTERAQPANVAIPQTKPAAAPPRQVEIDPTKRAQPANVVIPRTKPAVDPPKTNLDRGKQVGTAKAARLETLTQPAGARARPHRAAEPRTEASPDGANPARSSTDGKSQPTIIGPG